LPLNGYFVKQGAKVTVRPRYTDKKRGTRRPPITRKKGDDPTAQEGKVTVRKLQFL